MKVLVGGINQEANSFSAGTVSYAQFTRYYSQDLIDHLPQTELFSEAGIEVVPAVFATIMPSRPMEKAEFDLYLEDFFRQIPEDIQLDGIYLKLHGSMHVFSLGSGELELVRQLKMRFGKDIPIFGSFDFHGNITAELAREFHYITAYKTAPHIDEVETGCRAVHAMIDCLKQKRIPSCRYVNLPMAYPGELVMTDYEPCVRILRSVQALVDGEQVLEAAWFCGFIWSESEHVSMSLVVSAFSFDPELETKIKDTARSIWQQREDFQYAVPALPPEEAVAYAFDRSRLVSPVFLSDCGDNVTAGCPGDSAFMAEKLLEHGVQNTLLAGLTDASAVEHCCQAEPGSVITLSLGAGLDPENYKTKVTGVVVRTGLLAPNRTPGPVPYAILRVSGVDMLINAVRYEYTECKHFLDAGIDLSDYRLVCIKLGYLYPELGELAAESVLALTEGAANQNFAAIPFRCKRPPIFPAQLDFEPAFDLC